MHDDINDRIKTARKQQKRHIEKNDENLGLVAETFSLLLIDIMRALTESFIRQNIQHIPRISPAIIWIT